MTGWLRHIKTGYNRDMEYAFILLFLYASYLSIEKYVHTGSVLKWRGGQRPASGLPVKEEPAEPREETSEEAVIGRSRYRLWQSPPVDEEYAISEKRTDTVMKEKKASVSEFPNPFGRPEDGEVPERYEITGYVERPDPHRARGVTFDDMDLLSRFMTTDHLSEPEQSHARQTLERLEGTNVERLLQAGILGSDETLKRYIGLYVDSGREPPLLAGKNRESIIKDFDIMDFIPR